MLLNDVLSSSKFLNKGSGLISFIHLGEITFCYHSTAMSASRYGCCKLVLFYTCYFHIAKVHFMGCSSEKYRALDYCHLSLNSLGYNNIGTKGSVALGSALKECRKLEHLE